MYWARRRSLLGLSVSAWLILVPLFIFFAGVLLRWPQPWKLVWLGLALFLVLAFVLAGRAGYKRFVGDPQLDLDDEFVAPADEQRVPLRATGIFSVREFENYVVEHPAEYWRVPLGQHVVMVQNGPGSFLYQIIEPDHIQEVQPGYLMFGRQPQSALALRFTVSWGPEFAEEPRFYELNDPPPRKKATEERTVYFTFDHDADRHAVWRSLLRGGNNE
jgi:hypothetical protein